jgi:SPP1 gp7 family putative phage head morphogenesis protein
MADRPPLPPKTAALPLPNDVGEDALRRLNEISADVRAAILADFEALGPLAGMEAARRRLEDAVPEIAAALTGSVIESFVAAAGATLERSGVLLPVVAGASDILPPTGPTAIAAPGGEPIRPVMPKIEESARDIVSRRAVTRADFDRMAQDARQGAFTVAHMVRDESVARIQGLVAEAVSGGDSLKTFAAKVAEEFDGSPLAAPHLETVFRTNVQQAYTAGQRAVLANPLIGSEFPYVVYKAVRDTRARPEHRKMESMGLDGTAVFRRDDPVMQPGRYLPPWDFQCRCAWTPCTIERAARLGVREAQEWLRTGEPPSQPEFVPEPPFPPGFQS